MNFKKIKPDMLTARYKGTWWNIVSLNVATQTIVIERNDEYVDLSFGDDVEINLAQTPEDLHEEYLWHTLSPVERSKRDQALKDGKA